MLATKENLRGSIQQSNNLMRVALGRDREGTTEAQISNLENPLLLIEKVLGLQIAVEDVVVVVVHLTLALLEEKNLNNLEME
ncbi:hypothetical protein DEO72_LG3g942 [Vigna unguiculata]|uniref:Uncharacterized protein n=1 Tax=Vigna unguiculata TaxID=3917 RepID=A0A4D6LCU8_VIGUN|nr:hypothetical protein DEO72_LG3g941 [Vigna unguiculata]QCD86420.1 hypothetical protein DEO72_LG3g942 [Vigna unguiculata]